MRLLWFAVLASPAAVALNQLTGYMLVKWACASGHKNVLTAISVAALLLTIAGAWVGWRCRDRLRDANEHGGRVTDRSYFVAIGPLLVAVGLMMLELFVAFLQAFIFALLASVFIGQLRTAHH